MQDEPTRWDSTYYMLSRMVQQHRAISLYDADFGLPEQLNSNEWQQAEKIVKLLEPVQRVTKELSAKEAMLSQVIPFIEILKMELGSTGDDDRGIISTKEEMLKSLKSHFEHVYSDDNCVIATLLDPRFKATFYDAAATEFAIQTLVKLCEGLNEQQNQMPKSQNTRDSQQAVGELVECVDNTEPTSSETSENVTITTTSEKKGFNVWESYKKAVKKLAKPASSSSSHPLSFRERVSTMVTDYLDEPVTENPKNKKFMDPLEYWINNKKRYPVLAEVAKKYLSAPPSLVPSESLFSETGIIDSNRRRRLLSERLEMLTFIKHNLVSMKFTVDF